MSYVKIPDSVFNHIIKALQQGYSVCEGVDYTSNEVEKRPEYATGYSRATIQEVLDYLNGCKNNN
jgi:hypothetical protein